MLSREEEFLLKRLHLKVARFDNTNFTYLTDQGRTMYVRVKFGNKEIRVRFGGTPHEPN